MNELIEIEDLILNQIEDERQERREARKARRQRRPSEAALLAQVSWGDGALRDRILTDAISG